MPDRPCTNHHYRRHPHWAHLFSRGRSLKHSQEIKLIDGPRLVHSGAVPTRRAECQLFSICSPIYICTKSGRTRLK
ncbi:hypothetical protein ANN_03050 [Periplaneta americana]|uniref:Uncharacterized protein n=1 Tax=Periplaneta americana TaxID=6978 RepID=A0ABQ8TZL7_PERAM|nr:hypothetical protein ANN_03050 [Periplaneta americana]